MQVNASVDPHGRTGVLATVPDLGFIMQKFDTEAHSREDKVLALTLLIILQQTVMLDKCIKCHKVLEEVFRSFA